MRLYSENSSPFSAPVRLAIYAKGLDIDIEPPPGGLLSAKFHAINPLGTIPCLMLENGAPLPESVAILEYIEDKFPHPPLRPERPEARAHVRLLQRIGELQITTPLVELARLDGHATSDPTVATWLTDPRAFVPATLSARGRACRRPASDARRLPARVGAVSAAENRAADRQAQPARRLSPAVALCRGSRRASGGAPRPRRDGAGLGRARRGGLALTGA
jgi:hypothetical protein